jgi:hypothetical protein
VQPEHEQQINAETHDDQEHFVEALVRGGGHGPVGAVLPGDAVGDRSGEQTAEQYDIGQRADDQQMRDCPELYRYHTTRAGPQTNMWRRRTPLFGSNPDPSSSYWFATFCRQSQLSVSLWTCPGSVDD